MMNAKPTKEHTWLQQLIGDWTYEHDMPSEDGKPAEKVRGTERFRAIGEVWVQGESHGPMPGGGDESVSLMTLGFDPAKGRFVGSWVGSVITHFWVYDGELSADGRSLALLSEGPAMDGSGTIAPYKDIITFVSDDHRTLTGNHQTPDGAWHEFMIMHYRRVK
jgi:hypothetical protein